MSRRTGIDLSQARCTVVDAETTSRWRTHGERTLVRVHAFARLGKPESAQALTAELRALADTRGFSRHAWVTLWNVRSTHHYTWLPAAEASGANALAVRHGASVLVVPPREVSVGVARAPAPAAAGQQKIELSLFAAASRDIQQALRPVRDAGFIVEGVATPCGALWAQARLRKSAVPGDVHAYVALGAAMSALAIVSDGFLLYARELHWGYGASPDGDGETAPGREELATRLAAELRRSFLYLKQYWEQDVSQVLLCGDMPEIRSLTAPLIERLNIEVETLDTLDGIDPAALPEPAESFVDHVAELRLATAVAVEPPPVNLLPVEVTELHVGRASQIALAAGSAAAVAFGAFLYARADAGAKSADREVAALQRQIAATVARVQANQAVPK